ncbi:hypothetical protein S245_058275, partial [Arachis hypogaea]
ATLMLLKKVWWLTAMDSSLCLMSPAMSSLRSSSSWRRNTISSRPTTKLPPTTRAGPPPFSTGTATFSPICI